MGYLRAQIPWPLGGQCMWSLGVQLTLTAWMVLLVALLSGAFQAALSSTQVDCINAKSQCLQEASCNASYHLFEQCQSEANHGEMTQKECQEVKRTLHRSSLGMCKCPRTISREKQCLGIYWAVHPVFTTGFLDLEDSPYEGTEMEHPSTTDFSRLAAALPATLLKGHNQCLDVAHLCVANRRCRKHRNDYVSACSATSTGGPCDRRRCHRQLRHFFEKVPEDFTRSMLFCACEDAQCAERRRNTIVPQCAHKEPKQRNCLQLLDSCKHDRDHVCRSRLAHFQSQCQFLGRDHGACAHVHRDACLQSYMGLIGTTLTPNYISNSSLDISLWCTCEGSGNLLEECNAVLHLFTSNTCLQTAIRAQMGLNPVLPQALSTSGTFQRDGGDASLTSEMQQVVEVDTGKFAERHEITTWGSGVPSNNTSAGSLMPSLPLTLLLGFLQAAQL